MRILRDGRTHWTDLDCPRTHFNWGYHSAVQDLGRLGRRQSRFLADHTGAVAGPFVSTYSAGYFYGELAVLNSEQSADSTGAWDKFLGRPDVSIVDVFRMIRHVAVFGLADTLHRKDGQPDQYCTVNGTYAAPAILYGTKYRYAELWEAFPRHQGTVA